ncbi:MAG: hypothetical protein IT379_25455 [Deltaproteobacteria bacterium]|nr:hypothetical protein [Deltaproteobacteria bacterium]
MRCSTALGICLLLLASASCGAHDDGQGRTDCANGLELSDALVAERTDVEVLAVVDLDGGAGWVVREARGDRMSLCPDCNEEELPFCGECAHDVVRYEREGESVELDRFYANASYARVLAATASVDREGDVVVAWQRRLGPSGISPTEARFARVSADATEILAPAVQLYASEAGRLRLVAHPREPIVLALRDNDVVLSHIGTHVAVVDLDGAPLVPWTQLGSSLAHDAGASEHRDGFVVAFSDQAVDTPDPDCQPCTTIETCFAGNVVDVTEELPSMGCVAYLEASEAGGLQAVALDASSIGAPVQIRSGWYDRVYGGEMQRLYSDHGHASVVETDAGFAVVADYFGNGTYALVRIDVDFTAGAIGERAYAFDLAGTSPTWYALRRVADRDTLFVGLSRLEDGTPSTALVRALELDAADACASGTLVATYPAALATPLRPDATRTMSISVGTWDAAGGAFARTALHRIAPSR